MRECPFLLISRGVKLTRFLLVGTQMYCNWIRVIPPEGSRLPICLALVHLEPSGRPMWRNVRDLGTFIGLAIYAVSFASLFKLLRKPDADLPSPLSDQSPVLGKSTLLPRRAL